MPAVESLPPTLRTYLEAGCDLTAVPDLEFYARVILLTRHNAPEDEAQRLGAFFFFNAERLAAGESLEMPDGRSVHPTFEALRHHMWLAEGTLDGDVADMFEAALPADLRAEMLTLAADRRAMGWPTTTE